MVDYECCGGRFDCDCDDITGTWLLAHVPLDVDGNREPQLRRTRGNGGRFSNYVFPRIVRLTVETNTLTGASWLE